MNIDLQKLYRHYYGYIGPPFPAFRSPFNVKDFNVKEAYQSVKDNTLAQASPIRQVAREVVRKVRKQEKNTFGAEQYEVLFEEEKLGSYSLPIEPIIRVKGGNKIIRRYTSQPSRKGSIKERWQEDDKKVSFAGLFINTETDEKPTADINKLMKYIEAGRFAVKSPLLEPYGIRYMVVDSYDFPSTPSNSVQKWVINGYSDALNYELFETSGN